MPDGGAPGPTTARADLLALVASGRPLRTDLGQVNDAARLRRSAVLVLLGPLEASDHADPAHADVDLLLTRRSDALRHHPGQIAFPGGGLDDGEQPGAAALREAVEETGLDPAGVEVLGALPDLPVVVSGNVVTPVLAWWRASSELVADGVETAEAFRVPVRQLLDPAHRGSVTFQRSPTSATYTGPAFDVDGHVVWGFTAYVLDGLFEALGWAVPWDAGRRIVLPSGR